MNTFAVATYNIGDGPDAAKVAHLEHLTNDTGRYAVTIVGCQEASDRKATFRMFRKRNPSWRRYGPVLRRGASAVPILWDNAVWECVARASIVAVPKRRVGPRGAGPTTIKTKRINKVVLQHRFTRQVVTVLNTHTLPSATRHNLPAAEKQAREHHYRDHIAAVLRALEDSRGAVILTGDLNADRHNPDGRALLQPLLRAGLGGWTEGPTHHHATYDYVLSRGLQLVNERIVKGGSDHETVVHILKTA